MAVIYAFKIKLSNGPITAKGKRFNLFPNKVCWWHNSVPVFFLPMWSTDKSKTKNNKKTTARSDFNGSRFLAPTAKKLANIHLITFGHRIPGQRLMPLSRPLADDLWLRSPAALKALPSLARTKQLHVRATIGIALSAPPGDLHPSKKRN